MNKVAERARSLLLEPGDTLSQRVVRGGFWVFTLRIASRGLSLVRTIVLARVLAPADFGLMGIALLAMSALETFSQTGFQAALIQKKEDIEDYLDTAWTISALRGFVLFAVLYLAAPYIALFFDTPAATPIMRVIGVSMLLNGLTNIGVVYFRKELEFNKQFTYQLSGTIADLVVAITAALLLRSVWALVFGLLAGNLVRFGMSYVIHPYRPRVLFEAGKAKGLYGFGRWVLGSSILIFLLIQGDDALVGKVLGATALGFYQMAYLISNLPATEITHVISQVTFPAYSKLQDDLPKLRKAYLKTLQLTAFVSIPLAGGIFILAPEFTRIFLGDKWMPMIPAMQALCIFGVTRSINATLGPLLQGMGEPHVMTKASGIQLIIMATIIYPLTTSWGILGTSLAVIIPNLFVMVYLSQKIANIAKFKFITFYQNLLVPILGTVIMIFFISIVQNRMIESNLVSLFASTVIGITVYFGAISLFDRISNYKLRDTINWGLKLIQ